MNQPYHNNIDDHIVNNNVDSLLLDPSCITSLELLGCCNIPIEITYYFHMRTKVASSWQGA